MNTEEYQKSHAFQAEIDEFMRQKVVRQLHDGLTQTVSALAMRINYARRLISEDPLAAGLELEKVESLTREATKEIRHIIFLLRPEKGQELDLMPELNLLAERMEALFELEINLDISAALDDQMMPSVREVVYGLFEELIDSARKLGHIESLKLSLEQARSDLVQLKLEYQIAEESDAGAVEGIELNHVHALANLIGGSVMLGKENQEVRVIFPLNTSS